MHVAEQRAGPLVLLCHGFPEVWYSWRYQLSALTGAGFHAVVPDRRGSGDAPRPALKAEPPGDVFMVPRTGGMMANCLSPASLPHWIAETDADVYVDQFERTGYRGGLNWYRTCRVDVR